MPKLVKVEITVTYYAMVEDDDKPDIVAPRFASDAISDTDLEASCEVSEVLPGEALIDGWDEHCLLYHNRKGQDISIATARNLCHKDQTNA